MRASNALLSVVVAVFLTAGCGGGGGGDSGSQNAAPLANAGAAQSVVAGALVTLNGSTSSDADGDALTYSWTLSSKPAGSAATLSGATSVGPSFTADVAGTYVATLTVNDGTVNSSPATVTVTAASAPSASAEGIWFGTTSEPGGPFNLALVVRDDGAYYGYRSEYGVILDVFTGSGTVTGTTLSSTDGRDFLVGAGAGTAVPFVLMGTVASKSTLTGTTISSLGGVSFSLDYDASYDVPASLTDIAGYYMGNVASLSGRGAFTLSVASNGTFTGTTDGCAVSGSLTPRNASKATFDLSVKFDVATCGTGVTATGAAVRYATGNGLVLFAQVPDRSDAFYANGNKVPLSQPIALTVTNRDTVAHAVSAGVQSFATLGSVPVAGTASSGVGQVSGGGPIGAIAGRIVAATHDQMQVLAARERPATVYPVEVTACSVSGTWSGTFDDRDNSGTLTVGDTITVSFANCQEADLAVMNGAFSLSFTSYTSETSYGGTITTTNLRQSTSLHMITLNGVIAFNHNGGTTGTETYTAKGDVIVAVVTHVFSDTVTLLSGYVENDSYDNAALPPEGGSLGRVAITASGSLRSAQAGGIVTVTTPTPLVRYAADEYPRSGAVQVRGSTGTMRLTAQSQTNVLLALDADDNGQYESADTVTWDWLF